MVAVDLDGVEPVYTNRCGVSAEWCLTAPGGGDNQPKDGIEAARTGGGYTKKSGTSMAAPLVSGALGMVLEHMPNLSPRQAAARLIETGSYDGLETRSGCTIISCTEAKMKEIFGQGMINLEQALQPIGASSIINNAGQNSQTATTYITTPRLVGDAIKRGLEGSAAVVEDGFDGAQFLMALDDHIIQQNHEGVQKANVHDFMSISIPMGRSGFLTSASGSVPINQNTPAQLIDIPSQGTQAWHGYGFDGKGYNARAFLGYGDDRQALHFMLASKPQAHQTQESPLWIGVGMDQSNNWLDGKASGAFGYDQTGSTWVFAGHHHDFGIIKTTTEILMGQTELTPSQNGILKEGHLVYDSWSMRFDMPMAADQWGGSQDWGWRLRLDQPPALRKGHMIIEQPVGLSEGQFQFSDQRYDLSLSLRQKQASLELYFEPNPQSLIKAGFDWIDNFGHRAGQHESQFILNLIQRF